MLLLRLILEKNYLVLGKKHMAASNYKIVSISILTSKDTIISIGHESFSLISGKMYIKTVNTMFAQVVELVL